MMISSSSKFEALFVGERHRSSIPSLFNFLSTSKKQFTGLHLPTGIWFATMEDEDSRNGMRKGLGSCVKDSKRLLVGCFLTLKALKAGYTGLTRDGRMRESFNSKLSGNYTSVNVLSRVKAQARTLIAAIACFNLGSGKCICHFLPTQSSTVFREKQREKERLQSSCSSNAVFSIYFHDDTSTRLKLDFSFVTNSTSLLVFFEMDVVKTCGIKRAIWLWQFDAKVFCVSGVWTLLQCRHGNFSGDAYLQCWLKQHT
uniref:Uncharacterized protein n=1 Tax=Vespula pensylvanica TaxID=30213 RepID=A0A834U4V4_VESPE|nr:hypothetical protein H0235_011247 [Vespula pensylvanica]